MAVEGANFIRELTPATPGGGALVSDGDNEFTQLKDVFVNQFSGLRADASNIPVTVGADHLNNTPDKTSDTEVISGNWEFTGEATFSGGGFGVQLEHGTTLKGFKANGTTDVVLANIGDSGATLDKAIFGATNADSVYEGDVHEFNGDVTLVASTTGSNAPGNLTVPADLTVGGTFSPTAVSANTIEGTQYLETGGNIRVPIRSDSTQATANARRIRIDDPSGNLLGYIQLHDAT